MDVSVSSSIGEVDLSRVDSLCLGITFEIDDVDLFTLYFESIERLSLGDDVNSVDVLSTRDLFEAKYCASSNSNERKFSGISPVSSIDRLDSVVLLLAGIVTTDKTLPDIEDEF